MEALGLHLSSAISDHYLDIHGHHGNYPYQPVPSNHWHGRHDNARMYNHSHGNEFETQTRFTNGPEKDGYTTENVQSQSATVEDANTDWSTDDVKQSDKSDQDSPRQSQVALTLTWLNENYERADGVCLPRCVLYQHYLDFCKKMKFTPAGAATFGKIIRQKFPKLTTRRLGTRGQSKYHYYGIGIKESSIYYHSVYTGKGLTRFSGIKLKTEGSSRKYSLSSKTGTLLPEFPNAENLILPDGIELEKMSTFIMMYRTHSQRILDTVISGNFEEFVTTRGNCLHSRKLLGRFHCGDCACIIEWITNTDKIISILVQNFLVHFWQGMPDHLVDLLKCDILSDIIALCDSILYKVLVDVLIPSSIQELPTSLCNDMEMFLKRLPYWLETSMEMVPKHIQDRKQEVAKNFLQSLRRQSSFVNLAQTARPVLSSQDQLNKIVRDINNIDFTDICSQAGFMEASANPKICAKLQRFYTEFKELLTKQTQIESYTEWLDEVIDRCVIQPSDHDYELFKDKAAEFLLQWAAFGALLMRELTLKNASTFVSIHLVHLMLDEYAFLVIETQQEQEVEKHLQKGVQKYMKTAEEISTKAVVRNANNKNINSPKCKKRKIIEEFDQDMTVPSIENSTINTDIHSHTPCASSGVVNGTAFSRSVPTMKDTPTNSVHQSETPRHHQNTISIPTIKSYPSYNASYDRPTYIPQFGIGSYSEYVGPSPSFAPGRIPNYSESYSQTFPSNPFSSNISPVGSNYWTDSRSHPSFTDPYQSYNYNKLSATYDSLNKSTFLRNNPYQDNLGRPSFDSARTFYRGTHDNLQVGSTLPVGTYGSNFMDIAPPGGHGQYCYQDDLFTQSMASSFGKQYLSAPFR